MLDESGLSADISAHVVLDWLLNCKRLPISISSHHLDLRLLPLLEQFTMWPGNCPASWQSDAGTATSTGICPSRRRAEREDLSLSPSRLGSIEHSDEDAKVNTNGMQVPKPLGIVFLEGWVSGSLLRVTSSFH